MTMAIGGLMRSLKLEGAQTVPQLARARPVSQKHIQKLASEMINEVVLDPICCLTQTRQKFCLPIRRNKCHQAEC